MSRKFTLLSDIDQALKHNQFQLHYQPKVNLKTGEVIGAEALLRWQHPTEGLLSPSQFLTDIEHDLISVSIGEWVIEQVLKQLNLWNQKGIHVPVSVNIGARHLLQDTFISYLQQILTTYPDVSPELLELEILETSALKDFDRAAEVIQQGNEMGIEFCIDDFGSGYSSLVYLKKLPVKLLKIDQEFVRYMLNNPEDEVIVKGVLGLADNFKMMALAEGVETTEHVQTLLKLGCQYGQGYALTEPLNASDFFDWLTHWEPHPRWYLQPEECRTPVT